MFGSIRRGTGHDLPCRSLCLQLRTGQFEPDWRVCRNCLAILTQDHAGASCNQFRPASETAPARLRRCRNGYAATSFGRVRRKRIPETGIPYSRQCVDAVFQFRG